MNLWFGACWMLCGATLPNPASQFCVHSGGQELAIFCDAGESALCDFDGASIEEWTMFRYASGVDVAAVVRYLDHAAPKTTDLREPAEDAAAAAAYCAQVQGTVQTYARRSGGTAVVCRFDDNSIIDAQTLYHGPKGYGHGRLNLVLSAYAR